MENLKNNWVPLWVRKINGPSSGNEQIVLKGGKWESKTPEAINFKNIFDLEVENKTGIEKQEPPVSSTEIQKTLEGKDNLDENIEGYEDFLKRIQPLIQNKEIKKNDLIEQLKIDEKQFNKWIKKGVEDHKIDKFTRPVRYTSTIFF